MKTEPEQDLAWLLLWLVVILAVLVLVALNLT